MDSINGIFIFSIVLNLLFVVVEVAVGLWQGSLSLVSDAGHNLSDVFSLLLVLISFRLLKVPANGKYTYGYKKSTVLVSLINAVLLLVAIGVIIVESCHKFFDSSEVNGIAISWTAGVGILVNGITTLLLMRGQRHDINVRGAFLHMLADTLVSAGVVVSGVVIHFTGWNFIDPVVSLLIAIVILVSTWKLLAQSLRLIVDGTPDDVNIEKVVAEMESCDGVADVHHVHVWAISTTECALTAHVVLDSMDLADEVRKELKHHLSEMNILHSTLEFETEASCCCDHDCGTIIAKEH